ncbi:PDR/VanB family oxidoreductase [Hydrogenophaga sp. OTU3427]|uniref:PDR/VanB family oxidoreductase n=1 Tax=Hydrogenophaga sp. OTU3427 TaxID=3043856 RepID=UPI00313AAF93
MSNSATLAVRVARRQREAVDIDSFELIAADGSGLPPFSAGSHVDVHLPGGLLRQYSLCNPPDESHRYQIAVLRDPQSRGGSAAVHAQLQEGTLLQISEPRNHFALAHDARRHLLLAGGIGVTPILCMAERLQHIGADYEMHYCTRSADRTAFADRIRNAALGARVAFHFDDGAPEQKLDLQRLLGQPQDGTHLYVCGPKGFMDAVLGTARASGWIESQLHYEFFSAKVEASEADAAFEVVVASTGRVIPVAKAQTVVQALSAAGVDVQVACEQGVCGTCLTRVIEGVPDHKDVYLTDEERAANDQFTPCCSRSKSARLVLDL